MEGGGKKGVTVIIEVQGVVGGSVRVGGKVSVEKGWGSKWVEVVGDGGGGE